MQTRMDVIGTRQYEEALMDPRMRQIEPGLIMRPFHVQYPGFEQEWHVYCEQHPSLGFCGTESEAATFALAHATAKHLRGSSDNGR